MKYYKQLAKDVLVLLWALLMGLLPIIVLGIMVMYANVHTPIG